MAVLNAHYGMTATRNNAGIAIENGAIESPHGHLKQAIADALLMRATADFPDFDAYRSFVDGIVGRHNARNKARIDGERAALRDLTDRRRIERHLTEARLPASAIGLALVENGWKVLFTRTTDLVQKLQVARRELALKAVTRKTMRFVPVKSADQQAAAMVLETRELLVRQQTQAINALRAHLAELGIIAASGTAKVASLIEIVRDETDNRLPQAARFALREIADQIEGLILKIGKLE